MVFRQMADEKQPITKRATSPYGITIDDAYQKIKEMIYYNQLAPGQKLIYHDLAKRLNKSTTPVIQALNRLETARLVTYVPNKGYFVGEITETEAIQLYQAREALEIYIIKMIIQNPTSKMLDDIREAFKKYQGADRRTLILLDAQFHLKIAEYAQNDVIHQLLKDIFERIYLKYRPEYLDNNRGKEVVKEHREILKALRKRNEDEAITMTKRHIKAGLAYILQSLRLYRGTII